jgi:flagellar hook-basal body complex protein FliE
MIDGINPLSATSLASELKKATATDATKQVTDAQNAGASFADYMKDLGTTFADNLKDAEKKSTDGILGKASVREVVESVMTADQTLQTAMAFRDKIVSAYLEVVKMPI